MNRSNIADVRTLFLLTAKRKAGKLADQYHCCIADDHKAVFGLNYSQIVKMITTKNAKNAKRFEIRDCPSPAYEYGFFPVHIIPHPLLALCTILVFFIEVYE